MTTSVAIVVALVVLAVVVFATLARGKGASQLQAPPGSRPLPGARSQPPAKRPTDRPVPGDAERQASTAPAAGADARGGSARPAGPSGSPAAPEAAKASAAPAGASSPPAKRDVAGLRKGLAASRGGFVAKLSATLSGQERDRPGHPPASGRGDARERRRPEDDPSDPGAAARVPRSKRAARLRRDLGGAPRRGGPYSGHRGRSRPPVGKAHRRPDGRRQRRREDDDHRKAGDSLQCCGQEGRPGGGRHVPRGRSPAARGLGQARRV